MIGSVFVSGYGRVPLRIVSTSKGFNADGRPVLKVRIAPDFGGGPGGGEPLPLAGAA